MRADLLPQDGPYKGWVVYEWLYPGQRKFTAVKELRQMESAIREQGLTGWLTWSQSENTIMHSVLEKMGAICYERNDRALYFKKEVH